MRRQASASLASCAESDAALCLGEAGGAPYPRQSQLWQALGKDTTRALGSRAPETPDLHVELADAALPRQVAEAAEVSAVDTARRTPAKGTRSNRAPGMDGNDDAVRSNSDLIDDKADRKQGQQRLGQRTGSTPSGMASPYMIIAARQRSTAAPRMRKDRFCMSPDTCPFGCAATFQCASLSRVWR